MKDVLDIHTHTLVSGHAYNTIMEMAQAATEKGLGGCMFASVNIPELNKRLELPSELSARLVIALGYPKEEVVIEEVSCTDNLKYYRDEKNVHHVPKLKLEDVLL